MARKGTDLPGQGITSALLRARLSFDPTLIVNAGVIGDLFFSLSLASLRATLQNANHPIPQVRLSLPQLLRSTR